MKGRHVEVATVEESRRVLETLGRPPKVSANYDPPRHTTIEVASPVLILFSGDAVPPNFANLHLPHVRPRWQGPSRWSVAADWREWAATWGRQAAGEGRWERMAAPRIEIAFHRVRRMDRDGRFSGAKHLLDGLVDAGLLWGDDPDQLPDERYEAPHVPVHRFADQRTVVTVERLP